MTTQVTGKNGSLLRQASGAGHPVRDLLIFFHRGSHNVLARRNVFNQADASTTSAYD